MTVILRIEAPYRGHYELHRLTFGHGSPTVAIVAGLHGNELNSIHAINMLVGALRVQRPRGTVHLFPLVNSFGADEGRKRWPFDNHDINRAFPGDPNGTSVQRIAHTLLEATDADVCIDAHSGAPVAPDDPSAWYVVAYGDGAAQAANSAARAVSECRHHADTSSAQLGGKDLGVRCCGERADGTVYGPS